MAEPWCLVSCCPRALPGGREQALGRAGLGSSALALPTVSSQSGSVCIEHQDFQVGGTSLFRTCTTNTTTIHDTSQGTTKTADSAVGVALRLGFSPYLPLYSMPAIQNPSLSSRDADCVL